MSWEKKEQDLGKSKVTYFRRSDVYAMYVILASCVVISGLVIAIAVRFG